MFLLKFGGIAGGGTQPGLTHRAALLLLAIFSLTVIGLDMTRTMEARSRTIDLSRREVENIAWAASQHAEAAFRLASGSLVGLIERIEVDGTGPAQLERLRHLMVLQLQNAPALQALTMIDETGHLVVDATPVIRPVDASDRPSFQYHRDHPDKGVLVSAVIRSKITGKLIIPVSQRVNHADGSFAGTLVAAVEVNHFRDFDANFNIGIDGAVALWRDDGTLLVRHSLTPAEKLSHEVIHYTFPQAVAGTFEVVSQFDGLTRILSYRRLSGFPLVAVVALGKDEQLAAWRTDAAEHLAAAVLVALVLGFVGFRLMTQAQQTAQAEQVNALAAARTNESLTRLSRHLVQARDRAEQASRAKSRFLAGMSHELRTPLNGILGYAQLLHMDGGLNPSQAARVDAMLQAGKHLLEMITCVLDLSEIEADHVAVQAVGFDVQPVAEACLDLIRPVAETKGLGLSLVVAPQTPRRMTGDPVRLRQVLLNLLGNAAKFTSQGTIALRLRPVADGLLRIEVADSGPGIPAEQRQRLFQDFERLDTAATRMAEGAGLGLALSSRLAALIGGRLGYEDNPGGGSVFWLELPWGAPLGAGAVSGSGAMGPGAMGPGAMELGAMAPGEDPALGRREAPGPGQEPGQTPRRALRVLVVDDVLMNRNIASSFLRAGGHTAQCAEDGAEAVAAATGSDFDVVLMDVRMPGMDGLEATRRIRTLVGGRGRVPIVALTAQAFTDQVEACRKAGMDSHLAKPFDMDTLLSAVARAASGRPPVAGAVAVAAASGGARDDAAAAGHPSLPVLDRAVFERTAGFLTQEAVASSMQTIVELAEMVLRDLGAADAGQDTRVALADASHTLAGSAGMFGFLRLAAAGRAFERAVQTSAPDAAAHASALRNAVVATLREIPGS